MLISLTSLFGLAAVSKALVFVLIGPKWVDAVTYLRILAVSGIFIPVIITSANIINANGRSDITLGLQITKTVLTIFPILVGIFFNIEALLWAMAITFFIMFLLYSYFVSKVIDYKIANQLKDIFPILTISAIMAALVFLLTYIHLPMILILILQIIVGVFIILLIYEKFYHCDEYEDIKGEFFKIIRMFKNRKK